MTVTPASAVSFNLSVYSNSADQGEAATSTASVPFEYYEQFGRDIMLTVTDQNGTRSYHIPNNAPGAWVTFPVHGDATHPVTVEVAPSGANATSACISALAFDPQDNHMSTFTYNANSNDPATITDPLGHATTFSYHTNGTARIHHRCQFPHHALLLRGRPSQPDPH